MPRITKVYTRTGDDGETSLGSRQRVPKESLRIEAYGTVDELNSHLGAALAGGSEPIGLSVEVAGCERGQVRVLLFDERDHSLLR